MEYRRDDRIYDSETGKFHWALDIQNKIGRKTPGKEIGSNNGRGYIQITYNDHMVMAGRLAWFFVHGEWPKGQIDHINRDRSDNRLENLRVVTQRVNAHNRANNQKIPGVRRSRSGKRYIARIVINKKEKHLGSFSTEEEAAAAYQKAFDEVHRFEQVD